MTQFEKDLKSYEKHGYVYIIGRLQFIYGQHQHIFLTYYDEDLVNTIRLISLNEFSKVHKVMIRAIKEYSDNPDEDTNFFINKYNINMTSFTIKKFLRVMGYAKFQIYLKQQQGLLGKSIEKEKLFNLITEGFDKINSELGEVLK